MANDKTQPAVKAEAIVDAPPEILGDPNEHRVEDPHKLPEDVDPAWAGEYELTLGRVRIGTAIYTEGARMRLCAADGARFSALGVVKRTDGKRSPDDVKRHAFAQAMPVHRQPGDKSGYETRAA